MLVITYHAIAPVTSPVTLPRDRFIRQLDALGEAGYTFVPLSALRAASSTGAPLPRRAVALTFDDGYASVASEAWPILQARAVPASVFVIAGRLGQDNRWPGQASWAPVMPLIDAGALCALADAGCEIGAHTWSHPRLPRLDPVALDAEVRVAADRLEQIVGRAVRSFAYPYGDYGSREVAAVRARFDLGLSATCRRARTEDAHTLGRLDAHDLQGAQVLRLLDSSWLDAYLAARRHLRRLRRWLR